MDELQARADEVEADINAMKKAAAKQLADGSEIKRAMAAHEAAVEELRGRHADIIEAAQMQQARLASCVFTNCGSTLWPSLRLSEDHRCWVWNPQDSVWQLSHIQTLTTGSLRH